ncbi:hypothetical protein [Streptomyces fractus]|uniref:hypothetical protein n=1 Tax=Streptomyces fractus TaxID=641806 RepID=UPI003CED51C7
MDTTLTDTMRVALEKFAAGGVPFMGASTVRALERRGLITANTAPRDPEEGLRSLYMLTDAGREAAEAERARAFVARHLPLTSSL